MKLKIIAIALAIGCMFAPAYGQGTAALQGHSFLGGTQATTSGLNSSNYLNGVIPHATITVYLTSTTTLATIYADKNSTPLANPFTSNDVGSVNPGGWIFWAAVNQGYDVIASGGISPNSYANPVTLCADCFVGQSFSPVAGVTQINGVAGSFTFTGGAVECAVDTCTFSNPSIQTNGTPNADQTVLNHINTATIHFTNPSGGEEQADCQAATSSTLGCSQPDNSTITIKDGVLSGLVGGSLGAFAVPPIAGQYVIVYPTSHTVSIGTGGFATANNTSAEFGFSGGGTGDHTTTVNWSAFALPAGITQSQVTAIRPFSINKGVSTGSVGTVQCTSSISNTVTLSAHADFGPSWSTAQYTAGSDVGGTVSGLTCQGLVNGSTPGNKYVAIDVYAIAAFVYYSGTPVTSPTLLNVVPCLTYNAATNTLGIDTTCGYAGSYLLSSTIAALPNFSANGPYPVTDATYRIYDGATATDCSTGSGTFVVDCFWTGSAWAGKAVGNQGNQNAARTTVTGTTAGTAVWSEPFTGSALKSSVLYLSGYENTTATAQTITLPASFATVGYVITDGGSCAGVTISGATVTLPASMSGTQTGLCEIRGY